MQKTNDALEMLKQNMERTLREPVPHAICEGFLQAAFEKSFERKQYFVEPGRACNYQYSALEGACYSYYVNETGDKHAIQFAVENYWITDAASYFTDKPAVSTIETLESTRALLLSRPKFEALCRNYPLVERYFRILLQNSLAHLHLRIAQTTSEDAEHRYQQFSTLYPHFIQRIPQYLIASYLGIAPQSLSRIRKEIARKLS